MFFRDVIGQQEVKERLIKSVKEERVSHAQLFTGPEGTGKLSLALAYAQYISCRNRGENDSCGICPSCHKYQKLAHPDLHFVFPVFKNKEVSDNPTSDDYINKWREFVLKNPYFNLNQWLSFIDVENKQAIIYEKESESILHKLSLKPFESEFKVMVIWLPEKMHVACSNKLLKIIEEPPNKTLFLLISEDEENVISTIRSRAQLIAVPRIDEESMGEALRKIDGFDDSMVADAVHIANGSFAKALEYLNPDDDKLFFFTKFQELMRFAYVPDTLGLLGWADSLSGIGREKQKSFFENALRLTREFFIQNMKIEKLNYLKQDEKEWGQKFSPFINEKNINLIMSEFDLAFKHISANGNPKIIFLDVALKMAKHIRK
jgi:DNA polymerase III subunit delta'